MSSRVAAHLVAPAFVLSVAGAREAMEGALPAQMEAAVAEARGAAEVAEAERRAAREAELAAAREAQAVAAAEAAAGLEAQQAESAVRLATLQAALAERQRERAVYLTAQIAGIIAARYRLLNGKEPLAPKPGLFVNPGKACITCHTSGGEGPKYAVAGTVYSDGSDTDGCNGVAGVSVELIPVGPGNPVTLTTNSAGNFFASANQMFAGKYTARVIQNGKARVMTTPQTNGDCNSCHTLDGSGGAPGRVMTPSL